MAATLAVTSYDPGAYGVRVHTLAWVSQDRKSVV